MTKLSDMLIYLRKRDNVTQEELSRAIGISRSAIGMYESGKREPNLETLEIFADFYNVDMNTLTGKNTETSVTTSGGTSTNHNYAHDDHEEDMLLLARHMAPIPEEDRNALKEQFRKSIDLYLKALKNTSEEK